MRFKTYPTFLLLISLVLFSFTHKEKKELEPILNKIIRDLETVLSQDWYIVPNQAGFEINYCPTCMDKYIAWRDSTNKSHLFTRTDIFEKFGPDSVYFHSMVSIVRSTPEDYFAKTINNGLLKIKVDFTSKWDSTKINEVQAKNDALLEAILSQPVYKTDMRQFEDYRRYVPKNYWKDRTAHLGYSEFQRLPYSSAFYDYSIFIDFGEHCYSCRADYIISKNPETKKIELRYLDKTSFQTQVILAYVLGIPDFIRNEQERKRTVHSEFDSEIELR